MVDPLHVRIVEQSLSGSNKEQDVKMTFGELMLYHSLLQNHGIEYCGEERFIPLMERSKARIDVVTEL